MKTSFAITISSLLLIGTLFVSCNSCNKNDTNPTGTPPEATTETVSTEIPVDEANGTTSEPSATASHGKASNPGTSGKDKTKPKSSGYSAPNGTDAENHDGDPYTKNDTTPMPSGPPIK